MIYRALSRLAYPVADPGGSRSQADLKRHGAATCGIIPLAASPLQGRGSDRQCRARVLMRCFVIG